MNHFFKKKASSEIFLNPSLAPFFKGLTVKDPMEKNNLLEEEPEMVAEMEKELFSCLEKVEGKTYRSLLSENLAE